MLALALLAGLPGITVSLGFIWLASFSLGTRVTAAFLLVGAWLAMTFALRERVVRPLQTLSNMLAALRVGDYSIRARVTEASRDSLSLAFHEVNALEEILRDQRLGAVEATALLEKVLTEIDVAVFAFDDERRLQLLNRAGSRLLGRPPERVIGLTADELRLEDALVGQAPRTIEVSMAGGTGRWDLRRSIVRQEGLPLQLLVLTDLSRALREEERQVWKRLIRVLSHEINNSLAPIKSITGSLQSLLLRDPRPSDLDSDVGSGLQVISSRSEALSRFMSSYAQLARLPQPELNPVEVGPLVERVSALETRLDVAASGPGGVTIQADADQLEQLLINLIRNAVDAALASGGGVEVRWRRRGGNIEILVDDEGLGVADTSNLFVPFFTTKQGGSGIGLVLSRQIAESHGGSLELRNRTGGSGAQALLKLPLDPGAPSAGGA